MDIRLVRLSEVAGTTKGVLLINGEALFTTVELPWRDNEPNVSCVPEGVFPLRYVESPSFGWVYTILNVGNGRSGCHIHIANRAKELKGCVGIGKGFGTLLGDPSVTKSGQAFDEFMALMAKTPETKIHIYSIYGGGRAH